VWNRQDGGRATSPTRHTPPGQNRLRPYRRCPRGRPVRGRSPKMPMPMAAALLTRNNVVSASERRPATPGHGTLDVRRRRSIRSTTHRSGGSAGHQRRSAVISQSSVFFRCRQRSRAKIRQSCPRALALRSLRPHRLPAISAPANGLGQAGEVGCQPAPAGTRGTTVTKPSLTRSRSQTEKIEINDTRSDLAPRSSGKENHLKM
jgi:hypothetical protein